MLRRGWSSGFLADTQLWATFVGAALGGLAMVGGGIIHGSLLAQGAAADKIDSTLLLFAWLRPAAWVSWSWAGWRC